MNNIPRTLSENAHYQMPSTQAFYQLPSTQAAIGAGITANPYANQQPVNVPKRDVWDVMAGTGREKDR